MSTPRKPGSMCIVELGFHHYLLPLDKGMKLVELLQSAFECDQEYGERKYTYLVRQQPDRLNLEVVRPEQLRHPAGLPALPRPR